MAAADLMDPPVRHLESPFEGAALPALLAVPADDGARRATIVHVDGYDSTIYESFFAQGPAALEQATTSSASTDPARGGRWCATG